MYFSDIDQRIYSLFTDIDVSHTNLQLHEVYNGPKANILWLYSDRERGGGGEVPCQVIIALQSQ